MCRRSDARVGYASDVAAWDCRGYTAGTNGSPWQTTVNGAALVPPLIAAVHLINAAGERMRGVWRRKRLPRRPLKVVTRELLAPEAFICAAGWSPA
jgi:hypothetical protein